MDSWVGNTPPKPVPRIDIFLSAFDEVSDPRADDARHYLCELLVVGFGAVLCGATNCAEMADFVRAKEHVLRGAVERAYRRTDYLEQRHDVMARWGGHATEQNGQVLQIVRA